MSTACQHRLGAVNKENWTSVCRDRSPGWGKPRLIQIAFSKVGWKLFVGWIPGGLAGADGK